MSKKKKEVKKALNNTNNKKILNYYSQFLKTMDFIPSRGFVEIIDNKSDTISDSLDSSSYGLVLSPDILRKEVMKDKKVIRLNGKITVENNKPMLNYKFYKDKVVSIDKMNMFITNVEIAYLNIELISKLIKECNKFVFIGTYGLVENENTKTSIEELYKLKEILTNMTNKDFEGKTVEVDKYYVAAITPKLLYKKNS